MTKQGTNSDISVVIPALNAADYLPDLLRFVERQTVTPREIIIVDSSPDSRTEEIACRWKGKVPVLCLRVDFAYPGHARNLGVELARGRWIAFLDCRTIPRHDWLATCLRFARRADLVLALRGTYADTAFQRLLQAATYGSQECLSLAGSLVLRSVFVESGGFIPSVRAGEDLEWIRRVKGTGVPSVVVDKVLLAYCGLPPSLGATIRKWFVYTNANARIDVLNNQKVLYMAGFLVIYPLFFYHWNQLFARWDPERFLFIPHITKVALASLFIWYLVYRGVLRPLSRDEEIDFLLPWRWLAVASIGLCIDLAKAPGLILGALILLKKQVTRPS